MQRIRIWWIAVSSCILAAGFFMGCDDGSTSSTALGVTISPASAYVDATKVSIVTFTASGGDSNYTWSVSNGSLGALHTAGGTALYQSTAVAGTNTVIVADGSGNIGSATVFQQ